MQGFPDAPPGPARYIGPWNFERRMSMRNEDAVVVEEGQALEALEPRARSRSRVETEVDVVVIGGGQAGLSVGYHLARRGVEKFLILDANARVGDSWRHRWDSLRLFSPARFDGLDGMPFPAAPRYMPTKDEMADYLEAYARKFQLPVRNGIRVDGLSRDGTRHVVTSGAQRFLAREVVVAMADYQKPKTPAFAAELDPSIVQLHSSAYKRPGQLRRGTVLLVGAGNSGAEIAMELRQAGHPVMVAGPDVGSIPGWFQSTFGQVVFAPLLFRGIFHRLLTESTPAGRRAKAKAKGHPSTPLIRTLPRHLAAAGVERVGRVRGVQDGRPVLEDGTVLDVQNVIWSTGFHPGFSWVHVPVFDERGNPRQKRGVAEAPGLYFVGLTFLYAMSSSMIHGVGRDAKYVAERIVERLEAELPPGMSSAA
jgi:putative flavoprotein involved in K+ transport